MSSDRVFSRQLVTRAQRQLDLEFAKASPTRPDWAEDDLGLKWWVFHIDHPEVMHKLEALSLQLLRKGYKRQGLAMLWETLRYETMLGAEVPGEDVVRLNNNHRALYARYLMEHEPRLEGVFSTRRRDA